MRDLKNLGASIRVKCAECGLEFRVERGVYNLYKARVRDDMVCSDECGELYDTRKKLENL